MPRPTPRAKSRRLALFGVIGLVVLIAALTAAWHWTPLHEYANPRAIAKWLGEYSDTFWMPPLVAVIYIAASLLMFPNTVLCLAVIMALGPIAGTIYAFGGSLAAALAGYVVGRRGGKRVEKLHIGPFAKASAELRKGSFLSVLMLRLLPVAPFSATNILSGAAKVRLLPYVAATLVGVSPYILAFAAFGHQARRMLSNPSPMNMVIAGAIVVLSVFLLWQAKSRAAARR